MTPRMFSVAQRDQVRARVLAMARGDARVVAGAEVGSLAVDAGDRWSDLDLTFGLAPDVTPLQVLDDWTGALAAEFAAAHLFDLPFMTTLYRVFLLFGSLQVDLSCTPGAEFGALGPKFRLLFGEAVTRPHVPPAAPGHRFGLGVHHAVRARFSIARGRRWEALYLINALRDEGLALAAQRASFDARYGRGSDRLPPEVLAPFADSLVRALTPEELLRALGEVIEAFLAQSDQAPALAAQVAPALRALTAPDWAG